MAKPMAFDDMQESPEIAGLLYKRRGGFGKIMPNAWQYRFFVISKEGLLSYFDTAAEGHSESNARGRVDLRASPYELSMEPIEGAPTPFFLQIAIPNEEKWKLCAETKEDQSRWFNVLEKYSRMTKAPTIANYMSDDEAAAADRSRRGSSVAAKTTDAQVAKTGAAASVGAPPTSPSQGGTGPSAPIGAQAIAVTAAKPSATATPTAPVAKPSGPVAAVSKRRFLKSNKASAAEALQWYEMVFAAAAVNVCLLGVYRAQSPLLVALYVVVGNGVLLHTLNLRAARWNAALLQAQTASSSLAAAQAKAAEALLLTADSVSAGLGVAGPPALSSAPGAAIVGEKEVPVPSAANAAASAGGKPIAGATMQQVDPTTDGSEPPMHTWAKADSRLFHVRVGPDYNRNKKKAPSAPSLYEPVAFDVFCTKKRADHVAPRFQLPDAAGIDTHHPHVPPLLVIQVQIPSEPPTSIFSSAEDGPGWALVAYYRITEDTCRQLKDLATASPAVKLFAEWCEKAPHDPAWRGRFKVICVCTNFEELGFPSMITAYNGKPVLIRRTGTLFSSPGCLEMDIHVHKFANMAKQSIYMLTSRCSNMFMNIGFVIEGREDRELPETLFACVAVNRPTEEQAEFLFDEE